MYTEHFGLKALPFENVPDPAFFFDVGDHRRILRRMQDAFDAGRGLLAIAGPIGAGKTTLSQKLMAGLPPTVRLVWLAEPPETGTELIRFLAEDLGAAEDGASRAFLLRDVRKKLVEIRSAGERCLMIVDESHLMSDEALEAIRLLNNLEEGPAKLVQIILLGQQELLDRLSLPANEAFRQRIAGLEVLGKMDSAGVRNYVLHRLEVAGGNRPLFTPSALEAIALSTGGVPRKTNSLCDRSLVVASEAGKTIVDVEEVHSAATDLGMGRATMHYLLKEKSRRAEAEAPPPGAGPAASPPAAAGPAPPPPAEPPGVSPRVEAQAAPGIVVPFLIFLSSMGAFAASLFLYCRRAGPLSPEACLSSLLTMIF